MKRIIFSLLLLCSITSIFAQKPVKFNKDDITKLIATKKLVDAKNNIDQVLQNPKEADNKEALLYKAVIYDQLAMDSSTKASYPDALETANQTLLQLQQSTDTATFNKLIREFVAPPSIGGITPVSDIYAAGFNTGKQYFSNSDWENAYKSFKKSSHWANYIQQNGFSNNPDKNAIDTFTILYAGYAAQNAGQIDSTGNFKNAAMADSAMAIFTQLSNRQIHIPEMIAMYQFMIQYYQTKKDNANTSKYLALAKQYYPDKNDVWSALETQSMLSGTGVDDIIKNYNDKKASGGMSEIQYAQIGDNLANAEKNVKDISKLNEINKAAIDAYENAFAANPNEGIYPYNIGVLNLNIFNMLEDQYYDNRGEGSAQKTKREAIEKQEQPLCDTAIYWFEKAYALLSAKTNRDARETVSGNNTIKSLSNLYQWKMGKAQGHDADAFKKYEALYNKYSNMLDSMK